MARSWCWPTSSSTTWRSGCSNGASKGWSELRVGLDPERQSRSSSSWWRPAPTSRRWPTRLPRTRRSAPASPSSARRPTGCAAALRLAAPDGRVGRVRLRRGPRASLAARPPGLAAHLRRPGPRRRRRSSGLGTQDITADVGIDQLAKVPAARATTGTQAEWLRAYGLDELVDEGRAVWSERAHLGDLVALAARSRIGEAEALTDPAGLGGFRVLEWRDRSGRPLRPSRLPAARGRAGQAEARWSTRVPCSPKRRSRHSASNSVASWSSGWKSGRL